MNKTNKKYLKIFISFYICFRSFMYNNVPMTTFVNKLFGLQKTVFRNQCLRYFSMLENAFFWLENCEIKHFISVCSDLRFWGKWTVQIKLMINFYRANYIINKFWSASRQKIKEQTFLNPQIVSSALIAEITKINFILKVLFIFFFFLDR